MTPTTPQPAEMSPIPDRLKGLARDDWNAYRETTARYEAAWSEPFAPPAIDDFLPSLERPALRSLLLIHLIKEEYERRYSQGNAVAMARYIERYHELNGDRFAIQSLQSWESRLTGSVEHDVDSIPPPPLPKGYRLIRELPRGGMSRLFLIANASGGREVLKQIDPARRGNETDVKRFENEMNLARSLAAKGIGVVPVTFVGQIEGQLAYAMPYCEGGSLREHLDARGRKPLVPFDAARLVLALARTIQKLQEEQSPIIHRDLKPENVLFSTNPPSWSEPLIADLGLAKVLGQDGLTHSDAALGTWVYMGPELVRAPKRVDGRADVYALGVILYECLTGRRPFSGETPLEIIHRIYNETPVDPAKIADGVSDSLNEIVRKCLQKEPPHRYATARELAEDLERSLKGDSVKARQPGRVAKLRSWARRHPTESLAYAAALGALIVGSIVSLWSAIVAINNARKAESQAVIARSEARRADDNAGLITGGLGRLVERIGRDQRFKAAGLTALRNELLHDTVDMYGELVKRNPDQGNLGLAEALNSQALIQYLLGEIPQAIESAHRAEAVLSALPQTYEARAALSTTRRQLGVAYRLVNNLEEGLKQTQAAVTLSQALLQEQPDDQTVRFNLALSTVNLGNYSMVSNPTRAVDRYREALALLTVLRRESPANPRYAEWEARTKSNLGLILARTGSVKAAIELQRDAVAVAEQISDGFLRLDALATCRNNLAEALTYAQRSAEAEPVFREALKDYRLLATRFPNDVDYRWSVALVLSNIAALADQRGRYKEAFALVDESKMIFDDLSKTTFDKHEDFQQDFAKCTNLRTTIQSHLDTKSQ
jgi:serine/threonine protein kinase